MSTWDVLKRMAGDVEYLDPRLGKVRNFASREEALAWDKARTQVMKELVEDGFKILDPYGREIIP